MEGCGKEESVFSLLPDSTVYNAVRDLSKVCIRLTHWRKRKHTSCIGSIVFYNDSEIDNIIKTQKNEQEF